jgi:hypothetical protein
MIRDLIHDHMVIWILFQTAMTIDKRKWKITVSAHLMLLRKLFRYDNDIKVIF